MNEGGAGNIEDVSSIRKQGTAVSKGHSELHLLPVPRRNLRVVMSVSKSTSSWTSVPACNCTSQPQHSSAAEDLAAQRLCQSVHRFWGGVNSDGHSAATVWRWVEEEEESKEYLNLTFESPEFLSKGADKVHTWGGVDRSRGQVWIRQTSAHSSIKDPCCPRYLLCTFWWSTTLWAKSAGMDRGWVDAAAWQGVCETAVSSSPPWSPSCRAVVWAIAGEQSFHMWVCGFDADLSHRIDYMW